MNLCALVLKDFCLIMSRLQAALPTFIFYSFNNLVFVVVVAKDGMAFK